MAKLKLLLIFFGFTGLGYAGYNTYQYLFDTSEPRIEISGLQGGAAYKDEINCALLLHDDYKLKQVKVFLDGNEVGQQDKIGVVDYEYQLVLPIKGVPDGEHLLKIEAIDGSRSNHKSSKEIAFRVDNKPLHGAFLKPESQGKVFQGRTLHLQFQLSKTVAQVTLEALGKKYPCFAESDRSKVYECFIPIACDEAPTEYLYSIQVVDEVGNKLTLENKFQIVAYPFKSQRINVSDDKLKKESEVGKPHEEFERIIQELTDASPREKLWQGNFIVPTDIKEIGAEFGIQRTSQQRGRYIHQGLDILNAPRSVVWATQRGKVVLKDRFEISGNTIVLDHGCGVLSMFFHLDDFANIDVGDIIKKGNPVGKIGMSGYATGYHLHWEMRVNNVPVDPMQWTKNDF